MIKDEVITDTKTDESATTEKPTEMLGNSGGNPRGFNEEQ